MVSCTVIVRASRSMCRGRRATSSPQLVVEPQLAQLLAVADHHVVELDRGDPALGDARGATDLLDLLGAEGLDRGGHATDRVGRVDLRVVEQGDGCVDQRRLAGGQRDERREGADTISGVGAAVGRAWLQDAVADGRRGLPDQHVVVGEGMQDAVDLHEGPERACAAVDVSDRDTWAQRARPTGLPRGECRDHGRPRPGASAPVSRRVRRADPARAPHVDRGPGALDDSSGDHARSGDAEPVAHRDLEPAPRLRREAQRDLRHAVPVTLRGDAPVDEVSHVGRDLLLRRPGCLRVHHCGLRHASPC